MPVRIGLLAVTLYFVFSSDWFNETPTTQTVALQTLRGFFLAYIICNAVAATIFFSWERFPPGLFQWLAFILGLLDGLFVAGLVLLTDGFDSMAFWIFPILIVINAISIPLAMPQIVLNLWSSVCSILGQAFSLRNLALKSSKSCPCQRTARHTTRWRRIYGSASQIHAPTTHHVRCICPRHHHHPRKPHWIPNRSYCMCSC